jgi:hypothetical protein
MPSKKNQSEHSHDLKSLRTATVLLVSARVRMCVCVRLAAARGRELRVDCQRAWSRCPVRSAAHGPGPPIAPAPAAPSLRPLGGLAALLLVVRDSASGLGPGWPQGAHHERTTLGPGAAPVAYNRPGETRATHRPFGVRFPRRGIWLTDPSSCGCFGPSVVT